MEWYVICKSTPLHVPLFQVSEWADSEFSFSFSFKGYDLGNWAAVPLEIKICGTYVFSDSLVLWKAEGIC